MKSKSGFRLVVPGKLPFSISDAHQWFILKESLGPGGSADAYRAEIDDTGDPTITQKFFIDLAVNASDATYVSSVLNPFAGGDVGGILAIISGTDWTLGNYTIESITAPYYHDLVVESDGSVSSAMRPFTAFDVGLVMTITGGIGFPTGAFPVASVTDGKATLSGFSGTVDSTGGQGSLTPSARLDAAPGELSATDGHGYLSHLIQVTDIQARHRAVGADDLKKVFKPLSISEVTIESETVSFIYWDNAGASAEHWLSIHSIIEIDGDETSWYPGIYFVTGTYYDEAEEVYAFILDRPAGVDGANFGDGIASVTTGAIGYARRVATENNLYYMVVAMEEQARIAQATTAEAVTSAATDVNCVFFQQKDRGQSPLNTDTICSYDDLYIPHGESDQVGSTSRRFSAVDVGTLLRITNLYRCATGWYEILSVDEETGIATVFPAPVVLYLDFATPDNYPPEATNQVSSETAILVAEDVDLTLTIYSQSPDGQGEFTLGDYNVDSVSDNVGTLDANVGVEGSTQGFGYFSGMENGTGYTRKKLVVKTNGWSGPADSVVMIVWNEGGDNFLLDEDPSNDYGHDEQYYEIVREYPIPPTSGNYGLTAEGGVVVWAEFDPNWDCPTQESQ